jgi:hypothetical protein
MVTGISDNVDSSTGRSCRYHWRWRQLRSVTGGRRLHMYKRQKGKAKDALRLVLQRKVKKGMLVICDAAQQDESQICTHISDASRQHASLLLSVTHFVKKSHWYFLVSVMRLGKMSHFPYLWRVLFTHVTNMTIYLWRAWVIRVTNFISDTFPLQKSLIYCY